MAVNDSPAQYLSTALPLHPEKPYPIAPEKQHHLVTQIIPSWCSQVLE
jgi:hypothetical protein